MFRLARPFAFWLALAALLGSSAPGWAQDEDDDMPSVDQPAPARPAASDAKPTGKRDLRLEDPGVRSVMESTLVTPRDLLRGIDTLIDLNRPELAKELLGRLAAKNLDEKALARLASDFGSALFFKIARTEGLAPEGPQFADAVLSAARAQQTAPAHLAALVKQLSDPDSVKQQDAILDLMRAHESAVMPLVAVLTDPQRKSEVPAVQAMLARLGVEAVGPLLGVLESPDTQLATQAALVLGPIGVRAAIPLLLAPALASDANPGLQAAAQTALRQIVGRLPTAAEARDLLRYHIRRELATARDERRSADPTAETWRWDSQTAQAVLVNLPPADLAAANAARLGRDLARLTPDAADLQLALLAELGAAKLAAGLDRPLPTGDDTAFARAAAAGPTVIEAVLVDALAKKDNLAAIAAVEVLGKIGTPELLHTKGTTPSPLAQAANHPDRRLRIAAINAILGFKPEVPFTGAGFVGPELAFFAGTTGARKALVGHPRSERGQNLVGLLATLGYDAEQASNSRRVLELASGSPDYELLLLHVSLNGPPVDDLIARLRHDPRTADLPIGLMTTPEMRGAAERLAKAVPLVEVIPPVRDERALKFQVERVLAMTGRDQVSFEERQRQAAQALVWLGRLTDQPQKLFDLQFVEPAAERALFVPDLTATAALVLANLPSAAGQRALAEFSDRPVFPIDARRATALAFQRSVRRHGILLTTGEIRRQFDFYNASERQDRATQEVLALILDSLENKASTDESEGQP